MKSLGLIVTVLAIGCAGRLPPPAAAPAAGWVDFARVASESALGKRLSDEHATVVRSRQEQAQTIQHDLAAAEKRVADRVAAKKPPGEDLASERAVATQKIQQLQAEIQQHDAQAVAKLREAIRPVAAKLASERHLATVDLAPDTRLWSAEDLTDEVIRRMDAETYRPPAPPAPPAAPAAPATPAKP